MAATRGRIVADAFDDVECGRAPRLEHGDQHAAQAIVADDVGLRREAVAHVGHVPKIDRRAADLLDRKVVQFLDGSGCAVEIDVVFKLTDLRRAGRQYQVLQIHRVHHIGRRQALRLQQRRVQIDHHLALFAAVGIRDRRAGNRDELGAQKIQADVVELLLGKAFS